MESGPRMSCILRLDTSPGWHKTLTKVLQNVKDVSYTIDTMQGFAYISGDIDTGLMLNLIAKSGRHAELCQLYYGYSYNWTDPYSRKHRHNQHFHEMPSVQPQSSQDQNAPKPLDTTATATDQQSSATSSSSAPSRRSNTKTNNSVCCLM